MKRIVWVTVLSILATLWMTQAAPEVLAPVQELKKLEAKPTLRDQASKKKPLRLTSTKEASKYFTTDALSKITKKVDFEKQVLLLFAWRGSGQDKMKAELSKSTPEKVNFRYQAGRTRDLRSHTRVFAVRSDVKWSVQ